LIFAFVPGDPVWKTVALYTLVGGLIGAGAAAVPGLIDLVSLRAAPRRTAIVHMWVSFTVVALFGVDAWVRVSAGDAGVGAPGAVWLSALANALLAVSGWLGGKLVYERGVGVDTERSDAFAGRAGVVSLARFREQRRGEKQNGSAKHKPRSPEPPISHRKP
jgi:uncharacterized membrane protein